MPPAPAVTAAVRSGRRVEPVAPSRLIMGWADPGAG